MIRFKCPGCGKEFKVDDAAAGKRGTCKACGRSIVIPVPALPPRPAAPAKPLPPALPGRSPPSAPSYVATTPSPAVLHEKFADPILRLPTESAAPEEPVWATVIEPARRPTASVGAAAPSRAALGLGIASLALGILSLVVCWIVPIGLLLGGLGFALGATGLILAVRQRGAGIGFPIAGTAVNVLGLGAILLFLVAGPVLLGPIMAARNAGLRALAMSRMKTIVLAMHHYADAHRGSLPPAFSTDTNGKPLLSWRVAILPYLGKEDLYKQFTLDEAWDSPHNKALIARMPQEFQSPKSKLIGEGKANFLAVRGPLSMFPGKESVRLGTLSAAGRSPLMMVEVSDAKAVVWTRPDDFEYTQGDPVQALLGTWDNGFIVAAADGSVSFLPASTDPQSLVAMIRRSDMGPPEMNMPAVISHQPESAPLPQPPDNAWVDASQQGVALGNVRISVVAVKTGFVSLHNRVKKLDTQSKTELLTVWLEIENTGDQAKVFYHGWGRDMPTAPPGGRVTLTDEAGNTYKRLNLPPSTSVQGATSHGLIDAHRTIRDALVFKRPPDGAAYLRLTLPGNQLGQAGQWLFQIPKAMIKAE